MRMRHGDGEVRRADPRGIRIAWRSWSATPIGTDAEPGAGHGVIGMRERAQLAGGWLTAEAADGDFVVRATIPIGGAA